MTISSNQSHTDRLSVWTRTPYWSCAQRAVDLLSVPCFLTNRLYKSQITVIDFIAGL